MLRLLCCFPSFRNLKEKSSTHNLFFKKSENIVERGKDELETYSYNVWLSGWVLVREKCGKNEIVSDRLY